MGGVQTYTNERKYIEILVLINSTSKQLLEGKKSKHKIRVKSCLFASLEYVDESK